MKWRVCVTPMLDRLGRHLCAATVATALLLLPVDDAGARGTGNPTPRDGNATIIDGADAAEPVNDVTIVCGPLPFVSDGGACDRGVGAELARAACAMARLRCSFQELPWSRAQKEVEMRQADILIGPFYKPEREAWMEFSREHFYVDQIWLFSAGLVGGTAFADMPIATVGVPLGWAIEGDLESRPGIRLETVRTVDIALNLVLTGRLDAAMAHARAVARFHETRPDAWMFPVGAPLAVQRSYMGFSKSFASTLERRIFEAAYEALLNDKRYAEILDHNKPIARMQTDVVGRTHRFVAPP